MIKLVYQIRSFTKAWQINAGGMLDVMYVHVVENDEHGYWADKPNFIIWLDLRVEPMMIGFCHAND